MPPLHPALVHFPIAFLLAAGVLELGGALWGRERWSTFGFASLTAGAIAAAIAAASGIPAEEAATHLDATGETSMALHHALSLTTVGLAVVLWLARWWMSTAIWATTRRRRIYAGGLIVLMTCVVGAAYFGGRLVYEHGVGIVPAPITDH